MGNPAADALTWAESALGGRLDLVEELCSGGIGPWVLRTGDHAAVLRVGDPERDGVARRFRTEAAALEVAAGCGVPAPRLIAADLTGADAGSLAVLATFVEGDSQVAVVASDARLRALGAATATLRAVTVAPTAELPARDRSLGDFDFAETWDDGPSSVLLAEAARVVGEMTPQPGPTVLVHGDLWQGNTLWRGDEFSAFVDWDAAGVGQHGIDLGGLRCDVAIMYGNAAVDLVLDGWQSAVGEPAPDVDYWDAVAALATPADLGMWTAAIHSQGRADLDAATLTGRRDEFLQAALTRLGR